MMKFNYYEKLAMQNIDVMCYLVDLDTYELLYANPAACATFNSWGSHFVSGKTCYDFLHGKKEPCSFCNNNLLQSNQKLYSEIQNEKNFRYYTHIDSIIESNGKKLKLTFAYDTSRQRKEVDLLSRKISLEETLIKCVQTLVEDVNIDTAIMNILAIVCQFYDGDRAYLFEMDLKNKSAKNTYEWSKTSELFTMDQIPVLSFEELGPILKAFDKYGEAVIEDVETELDKDSALYKVLAETSCQAIQIVPIRIHGEVKYFMGVDNPRRCINDLTLLHSTILFVVDDIKKDKTVKQLEHLSYTDILTGLSNRNKYLKRLEELDLRKLKSMGYIHVNVNALKKINELYGEKHGDAVLKQVSSILSRYIEDDLFRISGDEFIAIFPDISNEKFDKLLVALRKTEQEEKEFSFAVGGVWQDKKIDIRQGLMQAMDIMFSEKQNYYKSQTNEKGQGRLNPVEIIMDEILSQLFFIHLQPKVNLLTGEIVSAEALIRKSGHDGKIISPDRFIPIYEHEGTIRHLDFFVLSEVCSLLQNLIKENKAIPIAVNFSRVTFIGYDMIDEIVSTCARYEVPHHYIKIELTESIDKMDFGFFHKKLKELKKLGFEISLDDFGAKHSNLLMLTMPEFTEVKIDKGLIDNVTTSAENRTVIRNTIKTIKELGKSSCVAEGIETPDQVAILQDFGCDYGQGYYFYRPLAVPAFLEAYEANLADKASATQNIKKSTRKNYVVNYDELYSVIEAMPLCTNLWKNGNENIMCNEQVIKMFDLESKDEYLDKFFMLSPDYQPDGRSSMNAALAYISEAREKGYVRFNWMHRKLDGEDLPSEITLVRLDVKSEDGDYLVAGYTRDLSPQLAGTDESQWATEYFFNEVSDKTLFNTISEIAAEFFWVYTNRTKTIQFFGKGRELLGLHSDKMTFPEEIVLSKMVPEKYLSEFLTFSKAMEDGDHYPIELEFIQADHTSRFFRIDYKIIRDKNNKPLFCIGKTADIHDKKMLELSLDN